MTDTEKIKQLEQKIIKLKRDNGYLKGHKRIFDNKLKMYKGVYEKTLNVTFKDKLLFLINRGKLVRALRIIKLLGGK